MVGDMVGCPGARLSVTPRAQKSSPTLPVLYSTTSTLCTWSYNCARGGMQYHGHTTVRGEECSIMVIQLCEGRNAVSWSYNCARGGMQYHGHTTVRGEECSIMVIQLCEGRNAVSWSYNCARGGMQYHTNSHAVCLPSCLCTCFPMLM